MPSKYIERINDFLGIIARNGEVYQSNLATLSKLSYRQVLRIIRFLEESKLIRLKRTEPSSKKGKEKNVWELTFSGLLQVITTKPIFSLEPRSYDDFDLIAEKNREKWIIFRNWKLLTEDKDIKKYLVLKLQIFAATNFLKFTDYSQIIEMGRRMRETDEVFPDFSDTIEAEKIGSATNFVLFLEDIFSKGLISRQILEKVEEKSWKARLWKIAITNPEIKLYIINQFDFENKKHKNIQIFKKWLLVNMRGY